MVTMSQLASRGGTPVRPSRKPPRLTIGFEVVKDLQTVLESGSLNLFYGGTHVSEFEAKYASSFNLPYAVACNSGTSALHLAYLALQLKEFSEVLLPANCYISAISTAIQCNLMPVLADIDPASWVMDINDAEAKISDRTSAIVPVHMYGQPCDMTAVNRVAKSSGVATIEDCGQSHGASWAGQLTGTFGDVACWSICCFKHVTAGEGGIVATRSEGIADLARSYAHKGKGRGFFDYRNLGFSYGMTELQAVVASHSLGDLSEELVRRQRNAAVLTEALAGLEVSVPAVAGGSTHAYFKYPFLLPAGLKGRRNEFVDALKAENVEVMPAHPYVAEISWLREKRPSFFRDKRIGPISNFGLDACPVAADLVSRQVTLEVGPGLNEDDMEIAAVGVAKVLEVFLDESGR